VGADQDDFLLEPWVGPVDHAEHVAIVGREGLHVSARLAARGQADALHLADQVVAGQTPAAAARLTSFQAFVGQIAYMPLEVRDRDRVQGGRERQVAFCGRQA
jgi:hypothetical protein